MRLLAIMASLSLAGCLSLPPPDPKTRLEQGAPAPDFALEHTGSKPGPYNLHDLLQDRRAAVIVFYRGHG